MRLYPITGEALRRRAELVRAFPGCTAPQTTLISTTDVARDRSASISSKKGSQHTVRNLLRDWPSNSLRFPTIMLTSCSIPTTGSVSRKLGRLSDAEHKLRQGLAWPGSSMPSSLRSAHLLVLAWCRLGQLVGTAGETSPRLARVRGSSGPPADVRHRGQTRMEFARLSWQSPDVRAARSRVRFSLARAVSRHWDQMSHVIDLGAGVLSRP